MADEVIGTSGAERKVGAQPGNVNAATHLAYSKRKVRDQRDKHRRAAEREAAEVLRIAGQKKNPLARLVAKQIRRLETIASRLESHLEKRGWFTRTGEPQPAMKALVDAVDRLLGEARTLLERQPTPVPSGDVVYRAKLGDGSPLPSPGPLPSPRPLPSPGLVVPVQEAETSSGESPTGDDLGSSGPEVSARQESSTVRRARDSGAVPDEESGSPTVAAPKYKRETIDGHLEVGWPASWYGD